MQRAIALTGEIKSEGKSLPSCQGPELELEQIFKVWAKEFCGFLAWIWQSRVASSHLFHQCSLLMARGEKKKIKKIELLTEYFLKYILKFLYYSKGQKTIPCWPNLTLYPFVYGHLRLSYGQKIFFKEYFVIHENYLKFKV